MTNLERLELQASRIRPIYAEEGLEPQFNEWLEKSRERIRNGELFRTIMLEELTKINEELARRSVLN